MTPRTLLAVLFVGLVHEERGRGPSVHVSSRLFGNLRRSVDRLVEELAGAERRFGIPSPLKPPAWGMTGAIDAWMDGERFEALADETSATPGEICRTFRLALQLMRAVRRTLGREHELLPRLEEALLGMNREEVDARRQLELG